jgi:hypothetical protein
MGEWMKYPEVGELWKSKSSPKGRPVYVFITKVDIAKDRFFYNMIDWGDIVYPGVISIFLKEFQLESG